jgi:hypothetical protein
MDNDEQAVDMTVLARQIQIYFARNSLRILVESQGDYLGLETRLHLRFSCIVPLGLYSDHIIQSLPTSCACGFTQCKASDVISGRPCKKVLFAPQETAQAGTRVEPGQSIVKMCNAAKAVDSRSIASGYCKLMKPTQSLATYHLTSG